MKFFHTISCALLWGALTISATAEERTLTPEQMEALAKEGDLVDEAPERPANLPDLTKGELIPASRNKPVIWTLGPTGIVSIMVGGFPGDQIQVQGTRTGSPAEGHFQQGDVITGMNGRKFVAGEHLGYLIGNAIIEAEKEENAGKITFQVWRDRNYVARAGMQDVSNVDVDKLFQEATDDNSLYDWKPEVERAKEVTKMNFDKYPIDPTTLEVELKLRVLPTYSDTAPYDCPKTNQILEDAWKVLEKKFVADPKVPRSGRGGIIEAIALVASGKPEHRKLVHDWVRSANSPWRPPSEPIGAPFQPGYKGYKGYQSWHHGFNGLNCALYYDATGDDFVLPALRKFSIETAMGQSAGGSWGHTFAYPSFNGGELHQMNPGYGALNAAGNRCFFLITLAQKLGIEDPEIDLAVKRAHRFFGSYVDQGCIPYGDHSAYGSDDSNGKNTGIAFSMKLLGDKYGAKYFAMMSSHCAFTRRGGHGHDYHGNWSSWAASLCGPEVRIYNERNLRWRRTLCRMYDGSFVYHSATSGAYGALRDPTSTEILHQAVTLKQTLITGKDLDEELFLTEEEMAQLLASARPQLNDPMLIERAGTPWSERSTDELFKLINIFYPKARGVFAQELGKRHQAGEKDIAPRLVNLLESEDARTREGACRALLACGTDTVLANLSKVTKLLDDPREFVRISAVKVISKSTDSEETQLAMLHATVAERTALAPNSVRNATQTGLFAKSTTLGESPFKAGFDERLVEEALEDVLLEETGGGPLVESRLGVWDKETVVRLAGPLTFMAEEEQVVDQMFGNRSKPAQAMLGKFGYREALETTAYRVRKKAAISREIRPYSDFKDPLMDPDAVKKQPGAFREFLEPMKIVLTDNPLTRLAIKEGEKTVYTNLDDLLELIEAEKSPVTLPSIGDDVRRMFGESLAAADGTGAKLKLCRETLQDPTRKFFFRQMAAMDYLVETLGAEAMEDLLPYLGHDYWRLREHSQERAAGLVKSGGGGPLAELFDRSSNPRTLAGILEAFARSESKSGLATASGAMKHEEPQVRRAAIKATFALGGEAVLPAILDHLKQAEATADLRGCEEALLSRLDDPKHTAQVREAVIAMLPQAGPALGSSLYYLLARIGDPQSIAALKTAGATDSVAEFADVVLALSYSPSREADQVLLEFAAADRASAKVVAAQSMRRMVLGPAGFGDITNAERMDFAEPMLQLAIDNGMVAYLGRVHEARALRALMFCLESGVESAAESLVTNAEGMENLSAADGKIAAKAVQDVIEYIEVTRLRGGVSAHMAKEDKYTVWKALQARAGRALLKLHKPGEAPIPDFDPLDLDP